MLLLSIAVKLPDVAPGKSARAPFMSIHAYIRKQGPSNKADGPMAA